MGSLSQIGQEHIEYYDIFEPLWRVRMRLPVVAFSAIALLLSSPAVADTPLDILGVEKSINDAARRAQETGDLIAKAFAEQALRVIAEWKKANESLITTAFDKLDQQTQQVFTQLNNIANRIERGEAVSFVDFQRAIASAGSVLEKIPGSNSTPLVMFYWPTIVIPGSSSNIDVRVIGTGIANANPRVTSAGKTFPVKKYTDNDIGFEIDRGLLSTSPDGQKSSSFVLSYDVSHAHWYNPLSWWGSSEVRERTLELNTLPSIPGRVTLTQTIRKEEWESQQFGPYMVGGVGQDNIYRTGYELTPVQKEAGWIVDKVKQGSEGKFDDNGGDGDGGSSCTGFDPARISDTYVGFNLQHGHKTDWRGHHNDAHQNCRIWVWLKRKTTSEKRTEPETKPLSWREDTDFKFDPAMTSYDVNMKLYTGISYSIRSKEQIPYSLFEMMQDKAGIKFRPRPQRDF